MRNVTVETKLTIQLTREQWQLYSEANPGIVNRINSEVQEAINSAETVGEAYKAATQVLHGYRGFGATDTEPMGVLEDLIFLRFPTGV